MSHQEIRQQKMLKDGSGWGIDNLPKHTDRTSEAKASKGQGDKKSRRSRHRSSSPEKDRWAHKRSSTSEPSERSRRHRHRHRLSSSESSDESGDRHDKGVSTNKNHTDVGSRVSRVRQALMFPEGM